MQYILYTSIFIFGTITGSFLNVLILRYGKMGFVSGRSVCPNCGKKLAWYELVPVISFFALLGKCSSCKNKISLQYPIVEILSGTSFLSAFLFSESILEAIYLAIVLSILLFIFFYDLKRKIIPDAFSFIFGGLAFLRLFIDFGNYDLVIPFWGDILAGPLFFLPFFMFWFFSRGAWMGLGDAKLAVGIGWFLGISKGISALILSFWVGAIVGLLLIFISKILKNFKFENSFFSKFKNVSMKSEIPFGPFLIVGLLLAFYFNLNILDLIGVFMLYN